MSEPITTTELRQFADKSWSLTERGRAVVTGAADQIDALAKERDALIHERDALIRARESCPPGPCGHDGSWKTTFGNCMACYHRRAAAEATSLAHKLHAEQTENEDGRAKLVECENIFDRLRTELPIPDGVGLVDFVLGMRDQIAAGTKFKTFVHATLGTMDVPPDPPGKHRDEGCRVGQRLEWLQADRDAQTARVKDLGLALACAIDDLHSTYQALKQGMPVVSIGQFGRLERIKLVLAGKGEAS